MNKLLLISSLFFLTAVFTVNPDLTITESDHNVEHKSSDVKSITFDGYYTFALKAPNLDMPIMLDTWYQDEGDTWAIQVAQQGMQTTFVKDGENIIMLVDQQGQKMKMSGAMVAQQFNQFTPDLPDDATINKTDQTKVIGDYSCDVYEVTTKDGTSLMYATNEIDLKGGMFYKVDEVDGTILGLESQGEEKVVMIFVSHTKDKSKTINTSEYKSMGQ